MGHIIFIGAIFVSKDDYEAQSGLACRHVYPHETRLSYLVTVMDWHSHAALSWRFSNTMDVDFGVTALEETLNHY
jgi:hypothetical protein